MKLYVPEIGDRLQLTKDWTFDLYHEYRNDSLFKALGKESDKRCYYEGARKRDSITLQKDLILSIDRIYVRKGKSIYSSLSFKIEMPKELLKNEKFKVLNKKRFWAKLYQCNEIEFVIAKPKEEK